MATQFQNISLEELISKPETDSGVADGIQTPLQTTDVGIVQEGACYSVLSERQKIALCLAASLAAIIAPFSSNIYYPAIHTLAQDLDVSVSKINLTVSTFQIFQGLGPFITAALSETYGRRTGYLVCLAVYAAANLALALQNSYPALLVLRILQSSGSSGTMVITQALVADIATRAERGRYIAFATMGFSLGPALGPVVGGLFSQYLGWRAIFWFLLGLGAIVMLIMLVFIRETCRSIVGDGSVPPPKWGRTLVQVLSPDSFLPNYQSLEKPRTTVTPLRALQLLNSKVNLIVVLYGGFAYAGYVSITVTLSSQLHARYGYSDLITGVCYLSISLGSLSSFLTSAAFTDWNFKREAKKQGVTVVKKQQTDIRNFDVERARLAVVFPMLFLACGLISAYGWLMEYHMPLPSILSVLFVLANLLTGVLVANGTLLTDLNNEDSASISASMNAARCLLSAGGVAGATPLINAIGIGHTSTVIAGIWLLSTIPLWVVYQHGFRWRKMNDGQTSETLAPTRPE